LSKSNDSDSSMLGYYVNLSLVASRAKGFFGLGVERIGKLSSGVLIASGFLVNAGKNDVAAPTYSLNPMRYAVVLQPFHFLLGGKLKFETGVSGGLHYSVFPGKHYAVEKDGFGNSDRFVLNASFGFRHFLVKRGLNLKLIAGPSYAIYSQHGWSHKMGHGELSLGWRFRNL
jgi:hypothetical protein